MTPESHAEVLIFVTTPCLPDEGVEEIPANSIAVAGVLTCLCLRDSDSSLTAPLKALINN